MGFWGTFVVHRHERLLGELLPEVAAFAGAGNDVLGEWQVTRVFTALGDLPDGFLTDLRDATGAPVLAADILDSDAAFVHAVGRNVGWQVWLHVDRAVGHLAIPRFPFSEDGTYLGDNWRDPEYEREAEAVKQQLLATTLQGQAAASAAVEWSDEAGLDHSGVEEVAAALTGHEAFVEDQFFELLDRLGVGDGDGDADDEPALPGLADTLRGVLGRPVLAIVFTPHRPTVSRRPAFAGMLDMSWRLGEGASATACGCEGDFEFLVPAGADEPAEEHALPAHLVGRLVTDAATIRYRNYPEIRGVVLRLGDQALVLTVAAGRWCITTAPAAKPELTAHVAAHHGDELRLNGWLATTVP